MIDLNVLRTKPELVFQACTMRGSDIDVQRLITVDAELRQAQAQLESLRASQKRLQMALKGEAANAEEAHRLKQQIRDQEERYETLKQEHETLWALMPNLLAPDTPNGESDQENVEIYQWGSRKPADRTYESHEVVGKRLGILDLERGSQVAGSGFYYWRGAGARLAWAVFSYALDMLGRRGFQMMMTPLLARPEVFFGTGYLPFFDGETYKLQGQDLALIGTSEQTLIGYYGGEMLPMGDLPIRVTAFSPCFRTEAGAAGRASRGAFRVHQFHKVEQIVICRPEESEHWHEVCQRNAQDILEALELPYRVVRVCAGDLGAPAYKKYDTEAWFPGFGEFRETHSNSNLLDYQARRFKIRFKDQGKSVFPHTISSTGITDRAVLAILENHCQPDGSVYVPSALRPYLGGVDRITKEE